MESFVRIQKDSLVLRSGLLLKGLSTVAKIGITTEDGRKLTEDDVIGILKYGQHSNSFQELWQVYYSNIKYYNKNKALFKRIIRNPVCHLC